MRATLCVFRPYKEQDTKAYNIQISGIQERILVQKLKQKEEGKRTPML
jgi:hypothetical protein